MLPLEWWKLSFLWFANLKDRSPRVRRGLFQTSFRVSVLSLSLGVAALSVTLALVTGFEWTLAKAVSSSQGHIVHVLRRWKTYPELEKYVQNAPPGLDHAEFYWNTQGLVVGSRAGRGVLIEGRRRAGTTAQDHSKGLVQVSLGRPLAEILGVEKGGTVRLKLPGVVKGSVEAQVSDLVSFGMYAIDSRLVLVDDESLRAVMKEKDPDSFRDRPGDAHGVRLFLKPDLFPPSDLPRVRAWLAAYEKEVKGFDPDPDLHLFQTWREQKSSDFKGIEYNKKELMVILSLLTLVAALNIAATLVVLFLERDREVAMLQALGLTPNQVLQWVGIQGLLLGLTSSVLGMGLGRVFGWILVRLPVARIPVEVYNIGILPLGYAPREQGLVFLFGVVSAVVMALVLGLRLSRIHLVSVLGARR